MTPQQFVINRLQQLSPTMLNVCDNSHLHVGHQEAKNGAHLSVTIVSEKFSGMPPLARHRLVYDTVGDLGIAGIHALNISARSPNAAPSPTL